MEVLYNASTYRDENGKVIGVPAAARDITARRRAEQELGSINGTSRISLLNAPPIWRKQIRSFNSANRELETFAFSVSHDLRAPLRAVDGYSHMLQEDYGDKLDTEAQRLIQLIRDGTDKMARLIDDILAFSRTARREMAASIIDMTGLVQATFSGLAPAMAGRNIEVKVVPLPQIRGDREMIERVWTNLLDNAIKYTGHKENAQIEVGSYSGGRKHCLLCEGQRCGLRHEIRRQAVRRIPEAT